MSSCDILVDPMLSDEPNKRERDIELFGNVFEKDPFHGSDLPYLIVRKLALIIGSASRSVLLLSIQIVFCSSAYPQMLRVYASPISEITGRISDITVMQNTHSGRNWSVVDLPRDTMCANGSIPYCYSTVAVFSTSIPKPTSIILFDRTVINQSLQNWFCCPHGSDYNMLGAVNDKGRI